MSEVTLHISRTTQPLSRHTIAYRNNPVAELAYRNRIAAETRARNEGDWKEARRRATRKHNAKVKALIFELLGGKQCVRCGFNDERALQFDHIHGSGTKHRDRVRSNGAVYLEILRWGREKFQVLCANCNWIKRSESKEHAYHEIGQKRA